MTEATTCSSPTGWTSDFGGDTTNAGKFYGFLEPTADISYITYSNAYVGAARPRGERRHGGRSGTGITDVARHRFAWRGLASQAPEQIDDAPHCDRLHWPAMRSEPTVLDARLITPCLGYVASYLEALREGHSDTTDPHLQVPLAVIEADAGHPYRRAEQTRDHHPSA